MPNIRSSKPLRGSLSHALPSSHCQALAVSPISAFLLELPRCGGFPTYPEEKHHDDRLVSEINRSLALNGKADLTQEAYSRALLMLCEFCSIEKDAHSGIAQGRDGGVDGLGVLAAVADEEVVGGGGGHEVVPEHWGGGDTFRDFLRTNFSLVPTRRVGMQSLNSVGLNLAKLPHYFFQQPGSGIFHQIEHLLESLRPAVIGVGDFA